MVHSFLPVAVHEYQKTIEPNVLQWLLIVAQSILKFQTKIAAFPQITHAFNQLTFIRSHFLGMPFVTLIFISLNFVSHGHFSFIFLFIFQFLVMAGNFFTKLLMIPFLIIDGILIGFIDIRNFFRWQLVNCWLFSLVIGIFNVFSIGRFVISFNTFAKKTKFTNRLNENKWKKLHFVQFSFFHTNGVIMTH